jgi:hypothetical protein
MAHSQRQPSGTAPSTTASFRSLQAHHAQAPHRRLKLRRNRLRRRTQLKHAAQAAEGPRSAPSRESRPARLRSASHQSDSARPNARPARERRTSVPPTHHLRGNPARSGPAVPRDRIELSVSQLLVTACHSSLSQLVTAPRRAIRSAASDRSAPRQPRAPGQRPPDASGHVESFGASRQPAASRSPPTTMWRAP